MPAPNRHRETPENGGYRVAVNSARPWLEAGRSHLASADRLMAHHRATASWWEQLAPPPEVKQLRTRARACQRHARRLDRLHARGWLVWHDLILEDTREAFDHVLIGPGGIAVLQTLPTVDRTPDKQPGPTTIADARAVLERWREHTRPALIHALDIAQIAADWHESVLVDCRPVLIDAVPGDPVSGVYITPEQVWTWMTGAYGAEFTPLQVQQLASVAETLLSPAPLVG